MAFLSQRIGRIIPSASSVATQRARELAAAGRDVLSLSQGEPDFPTPDHVIEAAHRAMREGQTRYTTIDGIPELKAAVVEKFRRENGLAFKPENVSVGAGGKQVLFNAVMASVDPGDEAVIPAPFWLAYRDMVQFAEGKPVYVQTRPENGFKIVPAELEAAITPRTKWLLLNSPGNPSGATYSARELQGLAQVLDRHPQVWLMSDDIYEHVIFDGREFVTMTNVAPQLAARTLVVNGVSKTYAMTGWRIGFGAGPLELIRAMAKMQIQATANPSSVSQAAAVAALNGPQDFVPQRRDEFQRRRNAIVPQLNAIPGLSCALPEGAFYVYVSSAGWIGKRTPSGAALASDADVALYLLEDAGVATVHGAAYGMSPYLRLSIASSMEHLEEACRRMARAGENLK
ncbi:MAG: pyridoxal phosphate-dependent aminotransferase [Betaproteobacteria bacterium]|nr:pyridoxal phosphate-dependent aminotransferase [Betaproteobacteria bacterium]